MKEKIFNIYLHVNDGIINSFGATIYIMDGTDDEKMHFLKSSVAADYRNAKKYKIPERYRLYLDDKEYHGVLRYEKYIELSNLGIGYEVFNDLFDDNLIDNPLFCVTPIVNGEVKVDIATDIYSNDIPYKKLIFRSAQDYLVKYVKNDKFYINELLNDDFFKPIKLLLNNKYYSQATKLLMSAIDTFAYLDYGDIQGNFTKWVDEYMDIVRLNVKSTELWELRNSLLHMTNYKSRKVRNGEVAELTIGVGITKISNNKVKNIIDITSVQNTNLID